MFDCKVCGGSAMITFDPGKKNGRARSTYVTLDDDEPPAGPSSKSYPCPECQPVFYLKDLVQIGAQHRVRPEDLRHKSFVEHVKQKLARILGFEAAKVGASEYMTYNNLPYEESEIRGRMVVVRNDAEGWANFKGWPK